MISWFEKKRTASILMVILIAIEIFFFSSIPGGISNGGNAWIPRMYHFVVFFLFGFFLFIAIKGNKKIKIKYIIIVIISSLIYAALDEIHQMFTPLRGTSITDFLTNSLGIFSSVILYTYTNNNKKAKSSN